MTGHPVAVLITITIPTMLMARFPEPRLVKEYLMQQGVWPQGLHVDRWTTNPATPGYLVEIEATVPLPSPSRPADGP